MPDPISLDALAGAVKLDQCDTTSGDREDQKPLSLSTLSESYKLRQQALSEHVAKSLVKLFGINVVTTAGLTLFLALVDAAFIYLGKITPDQRLVSEKVFMAIVGATTVQLGLGIGAIVTALFKQPASSAPDADTEE